MCLPVKSDSSSASSSTAPATRSIFGLGALMLLACLAGPAISGVLGGLGFGVLVGAGDRREREPQPAAPSWSVPPRFAHIAAKLFRRSSKAPNALTTELLIVQYVPSGGAVLSVAESALADANCA
jgi:hypothetical protein